MGALRVEREENRHRVRFVIYEEGYYWPFSGSIHIPGAQSPREVPPETPRPVLAVEVEKDDELLNRKGGGISWPSTSDRRPELAAALAQALTAAVQESAVIRAVGDAPRAERLTVRRFPPEDHVAPIIRARVPEGHRPPEVGATVLVETTEAEEPEECEGEVVAVTANVMDGQVSSWLASVRLAEDGEVTA